MKSSNKLRKARVNERMAEPPSLKLKAIRERAGITADKAAEQLRHAGLKCSGPSSYFRWEEKDRREGKPIPYKYIEALIPLFVGRGSPPVTVDEMVAISDASSVGQLTIAPFSNPIIPRRKVFGDGHAPGRLPIKYRVEADVFRMEDKLDEKTFGFGPIAEDPELGSGQFIAYVTDNSVAKLYRQGAYLHCAPLDETNALKGRRVVFASRKSNTGIVELTVGTVASVGQAGVVIDSVDGVTLSGVVLGVVFGSYVKE